MTKITETPIKVGEFAIGFSGVIVGADFAALMEVFKRLSEVLADSLHEDNYGLWPDEQMFRVQEAGDE